MKKGYILERIVAGGIVAVIRAENVQQARVTSEACTAGGILAIEVTYTVPGATEVIRELKERNAPDGVVVGAGTVLDAETARIAILAGADFVVGPCFHSETAKLCNRYQVPYIPGCMTISEMVHAMEAGCDIIKLFPGSAFEPSFIKDVKGPLPDINLMPTGGVSLDNVQDWIVSGAVAVGVGGQLTSGPPEQVTQTSKKFIESIQKARQAIDNRSKRG